MQQSWLKMKVKNEGVSWWQDQLDIRKQYNLSDWIITWPMLLRILRKDHQETWGSTHVKWIMAENQENQYRDGT